jgi:hypothetical protein
MGSRNLRAMSISAARRIIRWLLAVVGLLIGGLVFALVVVGVGEYGREYSFLRARWIGLVLFTLLVFGLVLHHFRSQWGRFRFWLWLLAMLAVHVLAYVAVLSRVDEWRAVWFAIITIVEGPFLIYFLEQLGSRRGENVSARSR